MLRGAIRFDDSASSMGPSNLNKPGLIVQLFLNKILDPGGDIVWFHVAFLD
jgi:hypothetical protein